MFLSKIKTDYWVYLLSFVFIVINSILTAYESYYFSLIPLGLLIIGLALFAMDKLLFIVVFCVPFSVPLRFLVTQTSVDMFLPSEPLLFGILVLFIGKLLTDRKLDRKIAYHPISLAIYLNLLWIFITCITSEMRVVSFKFLIVRLWFVVAFYFIASHLFINYKNIKRYFWTYIAGFIIVVSYTIIHHASYGFYDMHVAHWVMKPFFADHTSYGAILAMVLPVLAGLMLRSNYSFNLKLITFFVFAYFIVAITLSYTRAAWLSLAAVLGVSFIYFLRIKFRTILIIAAVFAGLIASNYTDILIRLEQNKQDSATDLLKHVKSMSNVATDDSNRERLNRWNCAFRMFEERPVFGWGPGTYMFKYAPFQVLKDKTKISTNAGDLGNAHSEYFGALAESGLLGTLTFVLIIIVSIITASRIYYQAKEREVRVLALVFLLGLITYYLHGAMNDFLDTDKASALFWGYTAMLAALDVYHKNTQFSIQKT